jgi:argininosuccinate lyase
LNVAELGDLPLAEFQAVEPRISEAARALLSVEQSVASRASYGGTAPARVHEQIDRWKETLK